MSIYKKGLTVFATLMVSFTLPLSGHAGNDASIKGDLRTDIKQSMANFIEHQTINGTMNVYDAVSGKLLSLKFEELHEGIVKKGDFYVSCADFKDQKGRKVDVDFMVIPSADELITTQALIHSIAGNKRKYHLEKL